jgi:hypothetical protein
MLQPRQKWSDGVHAGEHQPIVVLDFGHGGVEGDKTLRWLNFDGGKLDDFAAKIFDLLDKTSSLSARSCDHDALAGQGLVESDGAVTFDGLGH